MPDSKSAQSWYFFSILEIDNFLGFENVFPKLHDPSWFFQFFVFPWIFPFFVCLITRDRFFKKIMQNEMIMFFLKRDLGRNLSAFCVKKWYSSNFFMFCFPIDRFMKPWIRWFSYFSCLFSDWYMYETFSACNERLRRPGVKFIYRFRVAIYHFFSAVSHFIYFIF